MKSIGRPRRRIGGLVMNFMDRLEKPGMMHHPMSPIEIGIVDQKHQRKTEVKICPSVFLNIPIVKCVGRKKHKNYRGHCGKNQNRKQGIGNISGVIFELREFGLHLPTGQNSRKNKIEDKEYRTRDQEIAKGDIAGNSSPSDQEIFPNHNLVLKAHKLIRESFPNQKIAPIEFSPSIAQLWCKKDTQCLETLSSYPSKALAF
jgi:hypothetical protein